MELEKIAHDLAVLYLQMEIKEDLLVVPIDRSSDTLVKEYWDRKRDILKNFKEGC